MVCVFYQLRPMSILFSKCNKGLALTDLKKGGFHLPVYLCMYVDRRKFKDLHDLKKMTVVKKTEGDSHFFFFSNIFLCEINLKKNNFSLHI